MMMIFKRKEVLIGSLIMLILVAAFINYNYSALPPADTNITQTMSEQAMSVEGETKEMQTARKMGEAQYVNSNTTTIEDDYFTQAKMNKESSRSKSNQMLNEIIANPNVDASSKQKAQEDMLKMATASDKEAACENLIKAKGFTECVTFISGDTVSVTVKSEGLSNSDLAKIQEIVSSQTGISIKNIKIVEVK